MKARLFRRTGVALCAAVAVLSALTVGDPPAAAQPSGEVHRAAGPTRATVDTTAAHLAREKDLDIAEATRRIEAQARQSSVATPLLARLGGRSGGGYFDDSGSMVVTVTDAAAADEVRAAGLKARPVSRSLESLNAIVADLNSRSTLVNSAWGVDVESNQVVVSIPRDAMSRRDPAATTLRAAADSHGAAVRITETDDVLRTMRDVAGGDPLGPVAKPTDYCTAGFNVRYGNGSFILLAGHCFKPGYHGYFNWDGGYLGHRHGSSTFPGSDHGLIRITDPVAQIPGVYTYDGYFQSITYAADSYMNQYVCKSGATTDVTCGEIVAKNYTANYAQGPVHGLDVGKMCSAAGDSGGSMFAGTAALGILSGGNGACYAYFQPVKPAMDRYLVTLA